MIDHQLFLIAHLSIGDELIVGRLDVELVVRRFQNGTDLRRETDLFAFVITQIEEPEPSVTSPPFFILLAAEHAVIFLQLIEDMLLEFRLESGALDEEFF